MTIVIDEQIINIYVTHDYNNDDDIIIRFRWISIFFCLLRSVAHSIRIHAMYHNFIDRLFATGKTYKHAHNHKFDFAIHSGVSVTFSCSLHLHTGSASVFPWVSKEIHTASVTITLVDPNNQKFPTVSFCTLLTLSPYSLSLFARLHRRKKKSNSIFFYLDATSIVFVALSIGCVHLNEIFRVYHNWNRQLLLLQTHTHHPNVDSNPYPIFLIKSINKKIPWNYYFSQFDELPKGRE